eukprot:s2362_g7.t1
MSSLEDLWGVLRQAGLETVAPVLIRHGTTSVNQVALNAEQLIGAGLAQWQMEAILASSAQAELSQRRCLLPGHMQLPAEDFEDTDPSDGPGQHSRLPMIHFEGPGDIKMKDGFDAFLLSRIQPSDNFAQFSFEELSHIRDMVVLGTWYMLRESELAGAQANDLTLDGNQVSLTIPVYKTDPRGRFTQRTLTCSCGVKPHRLCVSHSAERHLLWLEAHDGRAQGQTFPLFPDGQGRTASKQTFIDAFRRVIRQPPEQADMEQIKQAQSKPEETFVFRPGARILHRASKYEANNEPSKWRTPCGWNYGNRAFLRTASKEDGALEEGSSSESGESSSGLSELEVSTASSAEESG